MSECTDYRYKDIYVRIIIEKIESTQLRVTSRKVINDNYSVINDIFKYMLVYR